MGSSGSRRKKVAPTSVSEGNNSHPTSVRGDQSELFTPRCQTSSTSVSGKRLQEELHREAQAVHLTEDDARPEDEVEQILENNQERLNKKKKSSFNMWENYTFCYRSQHDMETESAFIPTHHPDIIGGFKDKKDICDLNTQYELQEKTTLSALKADVICTKTTHDAGICKHPMLNSLVCYDVSEEDLMSAIEREFG